MVGRIACLSLGTNAGILDGRWLHSSYRYPRRLTRSIPKESSSLSLNIFFFFHISIIFFFIVTFAEYLTGFFLHLLSYALLPRYLLDAHISIHLFTFFSPSHLTLCILCFDSCTDTFLVLANHALLPPSHSHPCYLSIVFFIPAFHSPCMIFPPCTHSLHVAAKRQRTGAIIRIARSTEQSISQNPDIRM